LENKEKQEVQNVVQQQPKSTPQPQQNLDTFVPQKLTVEMLFQSVQASNTPLPAIPTPKVVPVVSTNPTISSSSPIITPIASNTPSTIPPQTQNSIASTSGKVLNGQSQPTKSTQAPTPHQTKLSAAVLFQSQPSILSQPKKSEPVMDPTDSAESISFITSLLNKNQVTTPSLPLDQPMPGIPQPNLTNKQTPYVNFQHSKHPPQKQATQHAYQTDAMFNQYPSVPFFQQQYPQSYPGPYVQGIPSGGMSAQQGNGLEKWFGSNIYVNNPLPPMPSNVKMVSLEEIEKSQHKRK